MSNQNETKKNIVYKSYDHYLVSDEFEQIKSDYDAEHNTSKCLVCRVPNDGVTAFEYHHFRYDVNWTYDRPSNLVLLCKRCHEWVHLVWPDTTNDKILAVDWLSEVQEERFRDEEINAIRSTADIIARIGASITTDHNGVPHTIAINGQHNLVDSELATSVLAFQRGRKIEGF